MKKRTSAPVDVRKRSSVRLAVVRHLAGIVEGNHADPRHDRNMHRH